MSTQQTESNEENTYQPSEEEMLRLKKEAREDYYRRQHSTASRLREQANILTEQARTLKEIDHKLGEEAASYARDATLLADLFEDNLKKDLIIDDKDDIIAKQSSALSEKDVFIEEQTSVIAALKARLVAYGIPFNE